MIKSTIIALVAVAALGGAAAPAFAEAVVAQNDLGNSGPFGSGPSEDRDWVADSVLSRLQQQGVQATSVEEWGGLVRAFVTLPNGNQAMQLFTPDTLTPVAL
jgi:hypothetical protein